MAEPTVVNEPKENKKEKVAPIPAKQTLAELLGNIVARVVADRSTMPQCKKDLEMWYRAQDANTDEERKTLARETRKNVETLKQAGESLFLTLMEVASADFQ